MSTVEEKREDVKEACFRDHTLGEDILVCEDGDGWMMVRYEGQRWHRAAADMQAPLRAILDLHSQLAVTRAQLGAVSAGAREAIEYLRCGEPEEAEVILAHLPLERTHAEVLAAFDRAIEIAEAEGR